MQGERKAGRPEGCSVRFDHSALDVSWRYHLLLISFGQFDLTTHGSINGKEALRPPWLELRR